MTLPAKNLPPPDAMPVATNGDASASNSPRALATSAPALCKLGLTPEMIARHVVKVEPPLSEREIKRRLQAGDHVGMRCTRADYLARGLTTQGKPRRRKSKYCPDFNHG
jgi:hypothetical protein